MFKKIWVDPVWSKVISVGIIGMISIIYATIKSKTDDISISSVYYGLFQLKVKVTFVVGAILLFVIIKRLTKKKNDSYYSAKQQKLRNFNKFTDSTTEVLFRWNVFFNYNKPCISDLEAYCTKHDGSPLRFINNCCSVSDCVNSKIGVHFDIVKNHVESILIDKWEKINNK